MSKIIKDEYGAQMERLSCRYRNGKVSAEDRAVTLASFLARKIEEDTGDSDAVATAHKLAIRITRLLRNSGVRICTDALASKTGSNPMTSALDLLEKQLEVSVHQNNRSAAAHIELIEAEL